ncbi:accessory factor UbiK family protein [Sansalvadorimonas sp. 2012CJ34-2]|uniref:Ubiquinone biosynthesis accessory factor UbiK n=1 Tax=Parendozoicomonas callyspongiae TaxID=2942213 RepID=A0ABT0PIS5_9GAMM|nr:accessory factor UbiK family protein [Sansalvadorimonas sp. 2012CJ34-2]MCL6271259.1 accessory factor UbiK family protein [Sansalvadorimonas sp. 2012CJ34-2]
MIDKAVFIGNIAEKLHELASHAPGQPIREDLEKNIRAVLTTAFNKMELLTREEFAGQAAVLQRTREMVEALEKRVAELEKQTEQNNSQHETAVESVETEDTFNKDG